MSARKHSIGLFLVLSTLTALVGSLIHPLMSLFVIQELQQPPALFGFYTVGVTIAGLVVSQWFGSKADRGTSTSNMYSLAIAGITLGFILYALLSQFEVHSFILVIVIGISCISLGSAAIPQMMTLARQWANQEKGVDITLFNTRMRAAISIAWIVGPALGFALVAHLSFSFAFYLAAACGLLAIYFVHKFIPKVKIEKKAKAQQQKQPAPWSFWLLVTVVIMASAANVLYSSALPLYVIEELDFSPALPGLFIATMALIEIPILLRSSHLARHYGKTKVLAVGFVFGFVFYSLIFFADQVWHFFALQIINAVFYGLFAGLSLTILQEQLPTRVGFTSAMNSNAIKLGMMIGSMTMGLIGQFASFRYANIAAAIAILIALFCLLSYHRVKRQENSNN